ncbi:hypothetical protein DUW77_13465 [Klebsiella pneumoniae]|nr:hypothetical protein DUW82_16255 [Klebsiella pneumoniae]RCS06596.1 hypothetical protein DUW77_13465 [Klebsiella pneumoniae]
MLKKTALSCAASPFTTVPQRDCHQPPPHSPENPAPLPAPFSPVTPNPTQTYLNLFSPHSQPHPQHNPSFPR